MTGWQFEDPPNVAVIANRRVVKGDDWIGLVYHDADDGAWQFHINDPGPLKESDAMVVSLKSIVQMDPSVAELADLHRGWHAWRNSPASPWQRAETV
jgi:hypothetical protein